MGTLDPTIDSHIRELVRRELPDFDPTKVEWVSEIPPLAAGLRIVRIGSVRDVVVCALKKGFYTLSVLAAGVSIWEAFVFAATLISPNSIPGARELAEIVRTGTVQAIDEFPQSLSAHQQKTFFVVREQLPADLALVNENSEQLPRQAFMLSPIAATTAAPTLRPDQPAPAAGPLPSTGVLSGTASFGFGVTEAKLDGIVAIPEQDRIAILASSGVSESTMQNALPFRFGVEDRAVVRSAEEIAIRRIDT